MLNKVTNETGDLDAIHLIDEDQTPIDTISIQSDDVSLSSERRCIATGQIYPKSALLRFVIAPDNFVTLDLKNKLPGRGYWIIPDQIILQKARSKNLFARAAKQSVNYTDNFVADIEKLIVRRGINTISQARRAGKAITGFEKISSALKQGTASKKPNRNIFLYTAALDGASSSIEKLILIGRHTSVQFAQVLTQTELGQAFGRSTTTHCILFQSGLAEKFLVICKQIAGFRPTSRLRTLHSKNEYNS